MAKGFFSRVFTLDFRSKPVMAYTLMGFGTFLLLIVAFKLASRSSTAIGTAGFYILYIPLWLIFSIAVLLLLSLIANILRIGLVVLFILGIFMIFVADKPIEGIMALGPVGIVMITILNFIITTLVISLVPGILAGVAVGALVGSGSDSGLAVLLGIAAFIAITAAVFNFIWKFLIPFSIGFSISLLVGKIVAVIVSVFFTSYNVDIPNISDFISRISSLDFSRISRSVRVVSRSLESLGESLKIFWQRYPVIFIGAIIFGLAFAAVLSSDEEEKEESKDNG